MREAHTGIYPSKKTREKMSLSQKCAWQDKDIRERRSVGLRQHFQNPKTRDEISNRFRKFWRTPENREKMLESVNREAMSAAKRKNWQNLKYREMMMKARYESGMYEEYSEKTRLKQSDSMKNAWKQPEIAKKMMIGRRVKPNKQEKKLIQIISENRLPYRYCGDGDVIIGGKCPDFINYNGAKKLVEFFGNYWHGNYPDEAQRRALETERAEHFAKYGFSTLIVWEDELGDLGEVVEKIKTFTGAVV